jgi:hypothetical protein
VKKETTRLIMPIKNSAQNEEKEKRAASGYCKQRACLSKRRERETCSQSSIITCNKELVFQNQLKEKRAAELVIANKELAHQNKLRKAG